MTEEKEEMKETLHSYTRPVQFQGKQFAWLQAAEQPSYLTFDRVLGHLPANMA